jgi:hypothetical protein
VSVAIEELVCGAMSAGNMPLDKEKNGVEEIEGKRYMIRIGAYERKCREILGE